MKKIYISVVIIVMCLAAFAFGSGMGIASNGFGTFNVTDANRFKVFTTKTQLEEYVTTHEGDLFNLTEAELKNYDEKFFMDNALVMFLTDGMSGSIKVSCEGYKLVGEALHVNVKELSPSIHTMDLKYNTLTVAIPQELAKNITKVVIESHRVSCP